MPSPPAQSCANEIRKPNVGTGLWTVLPRSGTERKDRLGRRPLQNEEPVCRDRPPDGPYKRNTKPTEDLCCCRLYAMINGVIDMAQWQNRHNTRLPGYDYNTPGAYFLTICVENRKCILSRVVGTGVLDDPKIELLPYGEIAAKYIDQLNAFYDNLSVESYVIMPNHIHILLQVLRNDTPSVGTGLLNSPTAKRNRMHGPSGTPVPTKLCKLSK